ncbi:MAG: hypothetical protein ACYC5O_15450 [Anaerolineae bacterium]
MTRWKQAILGLLLVLLALPAVGVAAQGQSAVVDGLLFYSETCPHCQAIMNEFLPVMREKYGSQINIELAPVSDVTNYMVLQELDNLYGVPEDQRGVPELFIGSAVMVGRYSIEDNFEKVVDEHLAKGGLDMPSVAELREQVAAALATQTVEPAPTSSVAAQTTPVVPSTATPQPAMHMVFLYQAGCNECDRVELDLRALGQRFPSLEIERYAIADYGALAEWLGEHYGVPEDKRLLYPAVFVGTDYLIGTDVTASGLEALVQKYQAEGAPRSWEGWEQDQASSEEQVVERFRSFGLFTLAAAGLIDGVNPCAFATLLFFVSYLALTGRSKGQIVATGAAFTIGVFVTYMLLGLGLYQLARYMTGLTVLAKVLYGLTAVICLVFGSLSLYDFIQARRGRTEAMRLKLPARLRLYINRSIRGTMKPGTTALAALVAGAVVSSVELVCTGQVYLPTIMFVASRPELRLSAIGALSLYNVAFVTPLVLVFGFAAYGSGSERLRFVLSKHTATLKLLTALVLFALGIWLASLLF